MKNLILYIFCFLPCLLIGQTTVVCDEEIESFRQGNTVCFSTNVKLKCTKFVNETIEIPTGSEVVFENGMTLEGTKLKGESSFHSKIKLGNGGAIEFEGSENEVSDVSIEPVDPEENPSCGYPANLNENQQKIMNSTCQRSDVAMILDENDAGSTISNVNMKFFKIGILVSGNQQGTEIKGIFLERVGDIIDKTCGATNEGFGNTEILTNEEGDVISITELDCNCDEFQENYSGCNDAEIPSDAAGFYLNNVSCLRLNSSFHHISKHATTIIIEKDLKDSEIIGVSGEQFGRCAKCLVIKDPVSTFDLHGTNEIQVFANVNCPCNP